MHNEAPAQVTQEGVSSASKAATNKAVAGGPTFADRRGPSRFCGTSRNRWEADSNWTRITTTQFDHDSLAHRGLSIGAKVLLSGPWPQKASSVGFCEYLRQMSLTASGFVMLLRPPCVTCGTEIRMTPLPYFVAAMPWCASISRSC